MKASAPTFTHLIDPKSDLTRQQPFSSSCVVNAHWEFLASNCNKHQGQGWYDISKIGHRCYIDDKSEVSIATVLLYYVGIENPENSAKIGIKMRNFKFQEPSGEQELNAEVRKRNVGQDSNPGPLESDYSY